jgi:hypothetical protein
MSRWTDSLYKLSKEYQLRGKKKKNGKEEKDKEPPKENKYKAKRTALGFPSQLEERVYGELLLLAKAGHLNNIERYPTVHLVGKLRWKVDFRVYDVQLGQTVYCEAKGCEDGRFTAIKQAWSGCGPGLLRIYKGSKDRVWIAEEIEGKK